MGDREIIRRVRSGQFSFSAAIWGQASKEAKRLISAMLNLVAEERPTGVQALADAWFHSKPRCFMGAELLEKLKTSKSQSLLKKAARHMITWMCDSQDDPEPVSRLSLK